MANTKDEMLGTESIPKLMLRLSLPAVAAQFINMLVSVRYWLAERIRYFSYVN